MLDQTKYVVVTGASSGIGYAVSKAFAKRGKHLIIIARRKDYLEVLRDEIALINPNLHVIIKVCDLSIEGNASTLYKELKPYFIEAWINNAGFGNYNTVAHQDLNKTISMLRLNIETLTILSTLYVQDYCLEEKTQLINISSRGGYTIVPNAVTYCASKFYVSAFTEGLAAELISSGAKMRAKVLAPAATQSEFGMVANDIDEYNYAQKFNRYHTSEEMAEFLLSLYDSTYTVGQVDTNDFTFKLGKPLFNYSNNTNQNQR